MISLHKFKMITKPFWVPAIAAVYIAMSGAPDILVLAALLLGWIGDLLLMRGRKQWFIAGAFSFLAGHLFYAAVFLKSAGWVQVLYEHPFFCATALLPYVGYLVFIKKLLSHNVASVFIAAAVYLSALSLMSYSSLLRIWTVPFADFLLTFTGSILFIISDTLIGVRNFKRKFRGIGTVIVVTYIAAQLLIVIGLA